MLMLGKLATLANMGSGLSSRHVKPFTNTHKMPYGCSVWQIKCSHKHSGLKMGKEQVNRLIEITSHLSKEADVNCCSKVLSPFAFTPCRALTASHTQPPGFEALCVEMCITTSVRVKAV